MKKKTLSFYGSILLILIMIVGCGSSNEEASGGQTETESGNKIINIGATLPLSGPGAPYGNRMINGMQMALEEINADENFKGYKVKLTTMDSQTNAQTSVNALKKLIDVNNIVWAATGYTEPPLAQQPVADKEQVVLMNSGGVGEELGQVSGNYFYNSLPLIDIETKSLIDYLMDSTDIKKLAIIHSNDEQTMVSIQKNISGKWKGSGREIVANESNSVNALDVKPQLLKIKSANPDALILVNDGSTTQRVVQQIKEVGLDTQLVGFSMQLLPEIMELPAAEGLISTSYTFNPDDSWVEKFKEKYNEDPDFYAISYHDQMLIFRDAALKVINEGEEVTGESLKKALDEIKEFEGANGKTVIENGISKKDFDIIQIENGQSKIIKSAND